jgi:hypothetical protein
MSSRFILLIVGGLPLPKVLKNATNHMISVWYGVLQGGFGLGMKM